jgi:hypothetical protein
MGIDRLNKAPVGLNDELIGVFVVQPNCTLNVDEISTTFVKKSPKASHVYEISTTIG